jgi:hypothetical protein
MSGYWLEHRSLCVSQLRSVVPCSDPSCSRADRGLKTTRRLQAALRCGPQEGAPWPRTRHLCCQTFGRWLSPPLLPRRQAPAHPAHRPAPVPAQQPAALGPAGRGIYMMTGKESCSAGGGCGHSLRDTGVHQCSLMPCTCGKFNGPRDTRRGAPSPAA